LWSLQIAVAGLLLAVCANLAGHLLARNASRRHEIAVRYALGAGRGRIVRQFLIESTMLAAAGAVAGTIVAWSALSVVGRVITPPLGSPPLPVLELDGALFAMLFAMATASALAFGVLPALGASRQLRRAAGVTLRKRHQGLSLCARGTLVAMQIAVSLLLLLGAGAAVQTFVRLASFDLGFDARRLILFQFTTSQPSPADILARVRGALAAIDGVESVAGISDWSPSSLALPRAELSLYDGTERDGRMRVAAAKYFLVTPGFFSTMKTPVLQGREFRDGDAASAPWTVVVNETAARQFWPGQNAIGKRLTLQTTPHDRPREVIGIVRDLPLRRQQVAAEPILYVPYSQHPAITPGSTAGGMFGRMTFVVRHRDGLDRIIGEAQRVVAAIDPYRPIVYAGQAGQLGQPLLELRNYGLVLAALAAAAAVLAVLGLYSVLAHWVSERRKEIGVRLSLGARPSEIVRLVLRPAIAMLTTGLVLGAIGMFIAPKPVALQTWRIETSDGITFAAAVAIVVTTALAGCLVPARHAARIDPSSAIRVE
jgi:predicted permease